MREPVVGAHAERTWVVGGELTAHHFGNKGLYVLATPALVLLVEHTCMEVVAPLLDAGELSVGVALGISHTSPTPTGMKVKVEATLAAVSGTRLDFEVAASDEAGSIGDGTHRRAVIPRQSFEDAVRRKQP